MPAAAFDPIIGMIQASAAFLHGKAFPRLEQPELPPLPRPGLLSRLWRRQSPAPPDPEAVLAGDAEAVAGWLARAYPRRRYGAVVVSMPSGALVHLCAALGIPWLPPVLPVPPRPRLRPETATRLVQPARLPAAYETFLTRSLAAGGTVLLVDGPSASPLIEELTALARHRHLCVIRLALSPSDRAESLSPAEELAPLVADLYVWWYHQRRILPQRLLVTSIVSGDPLWTLRQGAVPFWLPGIGEASVAGLTRYLTMRPPFDFIHLCLFRPDGAREGDWAPLEHWRGILGRAGRGGEILGLDGLGYPAELRRLMQMRKAIRRIPAPLPPPRPLALADFGGFLRYADRYRLIVQPVDGRVAWLG